MHEKEILLSSNSDIIIFSILVDNVLILINAPTCWLVLFLISVLFYRYENNEKSEIGNKIRYRNAKMNLSKDCYFLWNPHFSGLIIVPEIKWYQHPAWIMQTEKCSHHQFHSCVLCHGDESTEYSQNSIVTKIRFIDTFCFLWYHQQDDCDEKNGEMTSFFFFQKFLILGRLFLCF